ncbi:chorismate mutase [Microbacterium saccharophilum]|uniref:Chorismate mutase n=1 Tax=Microbacterium saccharophilum TaxID=1213358 RepID=A0A5C8I6W0_9MICO|nr:chorismate mutase [Microbacterium saccharophilum]TXK15131.1 chorismate mutase [Microbacterium saccharophilum]GEP47542.1 chorismate mutase [Microbacterium saccharophilum]
MSDATPEDATVRLHDLRASIDNIDAALIFLLAERFRCTKQVGVLKAQHGMPASDPAREEQQLERLRRLAADADLDPEFAQKWFTFVVAEVIRHHTAAAEAE